MSEHFNVTYNVMKFDNACSLCSLEALVFIEVHVLKWQK